MKQFCGQQNQRKETWDNLDEAVHKVKLQSDIFHQYTKRATIIYLEMFINKLFLPVVHQISQM